MASYLERTPLGIGETFTSEWFEGLPGFHSPDVMASCKTDADCTMYFDFSPDGVNADSTFPPNGFQVAAGVTELHRAVKGQRHFRIRIVNGSTAQTYLRLHWTFGKYQQGNLPANAIVSPDADAIVVRSVMPALDMALGRFAGFEAGVKFGRNADVDAPEDIWNGGGVYTGQPESYTPELIEVFSSDANDTSAGSVARTVRIFGLKTATSTAYESEDITLSGVTGVDSVSTWWRVNRVYVLTAGTGGANAGTITVRAKTTTANVFAVMPIGFNQTTIAAYTIPAGKSLILNHIRGAITKTGGSAASATLTLRVREVGGVYRAIRVFDLQAGAALDNPEYSSSLIPAGTDMKFRIDEVSTTNVVCDASFQYVLVSE
jgi:hypothetical protein